MTSYKQPVSVLVVIYTPNLDVLLIERARHPGFWQSVTGSREHNEALIETARREVFEETGIATSQHAITDWHITNHFEIFPEWRDRYAPGTTINEEHVYGLLMPNSAPVSLAPEEHRAFQWLAYEEAAQRCFSWSNRDAILTLPSRLP